MIAATLAGFQDLLPEKALAKETLIAECKKILRTFGYLPIETPHLEYEKTLMGEAGEESQKLLYRFTDHGNRAVALRFDHTVPLARFVSQHRNHLHLPFKRYVAGNVFRGESPQAGRYREFTQFDFDTIGGTAVYDEAEILLCVFSCLKALGLDSFEIQFNHRLFFDGLAQFYQFEDQQKAVMRELDKLGKQKKTQVEQAICKILNDNQKVAGLFAFLETPTNDLPYFQQEIRKTYGQHPCFEKALTEIQMVYDLFATTNEPQKLQLNLSIARGLDYYTGIVYETFLTGHHEVGSICSGGRYDQLLSAFSKEQVSGVGASIGLDRLLHCLQSQTAPKQHTPQSCYLALMENSAATFAFECAQYLRKQGFCVDLGYGKDRIRKYFDLASKKKASYLIAIGSKEQQVGLFTLANLQNGKKTTDLSLETIANLIKNDSTNQICP